ncbi:MAG: hypothetical protein UW69_C0098G0002 [Microgenomates group bacterium GW2011_GWA2_44_7]|nr:MAG: hypothetical protein UW69_C0098G0002 [Microgenomates group bacterium GW2011_GWA2_44_7]
MKPKTAIVSTLTTFFALLIFGQVAVAAPISYGNGFYTNLCGSNVDATFYGCQAWCDPTAGFCSSINPKNAKAEYWVYRFTCDGQQGGCGDNPELLYPTDAQKLYEVARTPAGQATACNKTIQLDVFDKLCGIPDDQGHFGGWTCAGAPGLPDPNLKGYMVWYSGQCAGPPPPPDTCSPSTNASNPSPVNGASGVPLKPTFSWSWDCNPDWVKWVDVFIWDCNPNGDPGCSAGKPLSFAHLGPGATSASMSQFSNLTALRPSTKYYWEVVPNSDPTTFNFWNFTTVACADSEKTDAYVSSSGGGPWTSSLTVTGSEVYVKGKNRENRSPVIVSVTPGTSQSVSNDTALKVTGTNGLKLGSHQVTSYVGAADNACGTPATYTCNPSTPTLSAIGPKNVVPTGPVSYQWYSDFGQDYCGGDYPGDPTNPADPTLDKVEVKLYDNGTCSGAVVGSCTAYGSAAAASPGGCNIVYAGWIPDKTYCWSGQGTNDNGSTWGTTIKTSFTYKPNAEAWFQAVDGNVYAQDNLKSEVPSSNWLANTAFNFRPPSYAEFLKQVPVVPEAVDDATLTSKINGGGTTDSSDARYLIFNDNASDLNINSLLTISASNKVVLYVPSSTAGKVVNINANIEVAAGKGFFGLVTGRPIVVNTGVTLVEGLIFTDSAGVAFKTEDNSALPDSGKKQLTVNGTVIATRGEISLNRTLVPNDNTQMPAEQFNFEPSVLFTLPRGLRRLQYQVNEVPETGD